MGRNKKHSPLNFKFPRSHLPPTYIPILPDKLDTVVFIQAQSNDKIDPNTDSKPSYKTIVIPEGYQPILMPLDTSDLSIFRPKDSIEAFKNTRASYGYKHIPRPSNSFLLYRQAKAEAIKKIYPNASNIELSNISGRMWHEETEETKAHYQELAKRLKSDHQKMFPGYRFQPRRKKTKKKRKVHLENHSELITETGVETVAETELGGCEENTNGISVEKSRNSEIIKIFTETSPKASQGYFIASSNLPPNSQLNTTISNDIINVTNDSISAINSNPRVVNEACQSHSMVEIQGHDHGLIPEIVSRMDTQFYQPFIPVNRNPIAQNEFNVSSYSNYINSNLIYSDFSYNGGTLPCNPVNINSLELYHPWNITSIYGNNDMSFNAFNYL